MKKKRPARRSLGKRASVLRRMMLEHPKQLTFELLEDRRLLAGVVGKISQNFDSPGSTYSLIEPVTAGINGVTTGGPSGNYFRLNGTTSNSSKNGQPDLMLFDDTLALTGGALQASFDYRETPYSNGGAEGLRFTLYPKTMINSASDAFLTYNAPYPIDLGQGYPGVLHFHFDTFNNYQSGPDPFLVSTEPNDNHLEVNFNSSANRSGWLTSRTVPYDINDGNWHSIAIRLDPDGTDGLLTVKGTASSTTYTIIDKLRVPGFNFNGEYRAALWADYGAAISLHDIDNIVIETNLLPTLDSISDLTFNEDASQQTVSLAGISAGDGETQPLRVTATSSNTTLISGAQVLTSVQFGSVSTYSAQTTTHGITTGDFDGDGNVDIAVCNQGSGTATVVFGNADGSFSAPLSFGMGDQPYDITSGDYDGDGHVDIAVSNFENNLITVRRGLSNRSFSSPQSFASGDGSWGTGVWLLKTADVNNDGKLDILSGNQRHDFVSVLLGNGSGGFGNPVKTQTLGTGGGSGSLYGLTVADVNGDGKIDIAVSIAAENAIKVLLGNNDGTFSLSGTYTVGRLPFEVTAGDFDADGHTDLATVTRDTITRVYPLWNDGLGGFSVGAGISATQYGGWAIASGDVDGDGDDDVAFGGPNFGGVIKYLASNRDRTFDAPQILTIDPNAVFDSEDIQLVDLNHDGLLDVAAASNKIGLTGGIAVFKTQPLSYQLGFAPEPNKSGNSVITVTVEDGGLDRKLTTTADNASISRSFTVTVNPVNDAPTLNALSNITIDEDAPQQTVNLAGITAGGGETQPLRVTASSSNTSLIPSPTATYSTPGTTGSLAFTPVANQSGTAVITVTVEDGGLDGDLITAGDNATFSRSFTVTVMAASAMVTVGSPGNAADTTGTGAVSYGYQIGKYEVTRAEYTAFLNAVAAADPNGLWKDGSNMSIERSGMDGSYTYRSVTGLENYPIVVVSARDAARYANWLHNGRPNGLQTAATTEDGAYTLVQNGQPATSLVRNPGARFFLPNENEWYKAAYYDRVNNAYFTYATSSNDAPVAAPPTAEPNRANYNGVVVGGTSPVGSYSNSFSGYGTYDQSGNVWELTEGGNRRGGGFSDGIGGWGNQSKSAVSYFGLDYLEPNTGFRIGSVFNKAPSLNSIQSVSLDEDASQQTVSLAGISAGGGESQPLRVTATSSNTSLIPAPTVTYSSPGSTGSLSFKPVANQSGMAVITVTVEDGGLDGDLSTAADNATFSRSFSVTVNAVNDQPTFTAAHSFNYLTSLLFQPAGLLISADFNNDGIDDIAASHWSPDGLSILLGAPDAAFDLPTSFETGRTAELRPGDLDGDGDIDIAIVTANNAVSFFKNDGKGSFTLSQAVGTGTNVWQVALGDFDRDGDLDSAIKDNNGTLFTLRNDGTGAMSIYAQYSLQQSGQLESADFDGDGWPDLVSANANTGDVTFLYNDRSGNFQAVQTLRPGGSSLRYMRAGDFDGDGRKDLAIADGGGSTQSVRILQNQGGRFFSSGDNYVLDSFVTTVYIADWNQDGVDDILTTTWDKVWAISPKYQDIISSPVTSQSVAIAAGDFDDDGILDVATTNNYGRGSLEIRQLKGLFNQNLPINSPSQTVDLQNITTGGGESQPLRLTVTSSDTLLIPAPTVSYNSNNSYGSFTFSPVADRHGTSIITIMVEDGGLDQDLSTSTDNASFSRSFTVTVDPFNEPPTLGPIQDLSLVEDAPQQWVALTGISPGGAESQKVRITAVSSNTALIPNPIVEYVSANPTGRLGLTPKANQSGVAIITVTVEDSGFDGLFNSRLNNATLTRSFTVTVDPVNDVPFFSNGDSFQKTTSLGLASTQALITDDFNGDGIDDLAVAHWNSGGVSILLGAEGGNYSTPIKYDLPSVAWLSAADLDGDGDKDLALTTANDCVTILKNNGLGQFTFYQAINPGGNVWDLTVADFDRDGDVDVAVVNNDGTVYTLANDGTGNMSVYDIYPIRQSGGIEAKDFDGDGWTDITVVDGNTGNVKFLYNDKTGHLVLVQTLWTGGNNGWQMQSGDFDGDGRPDVALSNGGGRSIQVLMNQGGRVFTLGDSYSLGGIVEGLYVTDWNRDGIADILTSNWNSLWAISPKVHDVISSPVTAQTRFVTAGDFDADGILDIATTNISSETALEMWHLTGLFDQRLPISSPSQQVNIRNIAAGGGEPQPLRVTAASSNTLLIPTPTVSYSSDNNFGSFVFSPIADRYGSSIIMITVEDGGLDQDLSTSADNASFSRSYTVSVGSSSNKLPTLDSLSDMNLNEDDQTQSIALIGISAGFGEWQPLRVTATSSNTGLIPTPSITYTTANSFGSLAFTPAANQSGSAIVTVTVEDGGLDGNLSTTGDNASFSRSFTVTVNALNDAPTLDTLNNIILDEDDPQQAVNLSGISAGGGESQPLRVTATSSNTGLIPTPLVTYVTASSTGSLAFNPVANQSGTAVITVTVEDGGLDSDLSTAGDNATFSRSFSVTVNAVNDTPTDINLSSATIAENAGANATVGTYSTTDVDAGNTFTYTLVSGTGDADNAAFNISGSTLRATNSFDFESKSSYTIRVRSTDQGGLYTEKAFTITVTNVNETPTDIILSSATIAENAGSNATVGTLNTSDVDTGSTFTYTLVSGTGDTDNAAFNISASTLRATSSFDFESKSSYTVRVRSTDQGGLFIEKAFTITVTNVNETPTLGVLSDQTISSSAPQQVINLTGISAGGSESQSLRLTASSSNTSVIPTPQVSYVSPNASGTLSFTPVWGAVGSVVITVTVEDAGTDNDFNTIIDNLKTTRSFTVTVVNVNNPPTLNVINSLSIYEDSAAQSVSLAGITAGSGETQPLQVTAISNDPSLIPNPSVTYASPSTTGTLTFVPLADAFGTAVLLVTVEDGGADKNLSTKADNATFSRSFSVTLKPKNDAPTLNPLANLAISEDAPEQVVNLLGITAGGGESQTLRVTASSNNTALIAAPVVNYVSPSSTGSLKFTPVPDKFGTAVITVKVEDAGLDNDLAKAADNLSVTRAFTVTVNPVNDAPTLAAIANVTIAEDAAQQTVNLTGISAGGGETQPLRVTATSSNPGLIPTPTVNYTSASTTGSLAFTPAPNQAGSAVITVVVEDGGLDGNLTTLTDNATFSRAFTVTVSAVNDVPTLNALSNVSINEDAPQQTVSLAGITAGGGETQPLRVTATSSNTALIPTPSVTYTTANSTVSLSFAPVANQSGSAVITVTVEDGGLDGDLNTTADNAKTSRGFTVTVNPVNDIPTLDALPNLVLATSAPQQTVGLTGITSGGGESQPLKVTATSSNTTLIPTPTVTYTSPASTGSLKFTPAAGKTGTAVITVTVEDGGSDASLKSTADNAKYVRTFTVTVGTAPSGLLGASSEGNPMDSSAYLHNTFIPADVNRDNSVSAVDVLLVIGVLNAGGGRSVWDILDDRYLVDVNGDQFISSLDALLVINTLNSRPQGEAEAGQARPTLNTDTLKSCFSGSVSAQIQAASGNAIATVRSETNRNMIAELPWLERGHRADQLSDIETVDAVFAADDSLDFDSDRDHLEWIVEAINQHVVKKLQRL